MKTIEAKVKERIFQHDLIGIEATRCESDFEAGVKFAQRWISIQEELPEICTAVLAKTKNDFVYLALYNKGRNEWRSTTMIVVTTITHWRPIERY